jgi:NADH:ubiquinone oxidoreductase subunit E
VCEIQICLGSSCFSRGNAENLRLIQQYLAERGWSATVTVTGHLCEDGCSGGPNVAIDGHMHHGVDAAALRALLNRRFGEGDRT